MRLMNKKLFSTPALFVVFPAVAILLLFSGCTDLSASSQIPGIPYTVSQFISKTTTTDFNTWMSGSLNGKVLAMDGNRITFVDVNGGGVDSNELFANYIDFNLLDGFTQQEGRLQWDVNAGTLMVGMPGGNVNLQIGQEQLIRGKNIGGVIIPNGGLVYICGGSGNNPGICLADYNNISKRDAIGMATEQIGINQFGYVTTVGLVRDLNTSSFVPGSLLWLGSNGSFVGVKPSPPLFGTVVGVVIAQSSNVGVVYVTVASVPRLVGLSDVNSSGKVDGQVLFWDGNSGTWKTKTLIGSVDTNTQTAGWTSSNGTNTYLVDTNENKHNVLDANSYGVSGANYLIYLRSDGNVVIGDGS